jgi:hypothetical protein
VSAQPQEFAGSPVGGHRVGITHQALRREVNERISSLNDGSWIAEPGLVDVCCECVRRDCTGRVAMTVSEYEAVRRFPTRFLVKEGHEVSGEERVVAEAAGYVVVERSGREGLYAVGTDPRRRVLRKIETPTT